MASVCTVLLWGFVKHVLLLRDFDDLPELTLGSGDKRHSQASSSESPWGG